MLKPRVYVETTIPSFYHEARTAPDIVARREWTRQWWSNAAERYELVTSPAVLDELASGPPERSHEWLTLFRDLPLLPVEPAIAEIVQAYIRHRWSCWEGVMNPNQNDPVIDEIREVRHRISERFGHDPARLVAYYTEFRERYRDRLTDMAKPLERTDQPAA